MSADSADAAAPLSRADWFATVAGVCGSLVGIGLARFAYTPLIPPLIGAHWFSSADTVTLGAANFAGYLAGALLGRPIATAMSNRSAMRALMLLATAAFFACAWPLSIAWFFVWRFASGLAGGSIMVLVAATIVPHVPAARRGFVGGVIFLGIGLGVVASGTLIPLLLRGGLRETWIALGALSLLLTAVSWFGWPAVNPPAPDTETATREKKRATLSLRILYGQYAANALGLVPVMVLLVDYIARGLGRGASIGAEYWVLYGLAATAGPVLCGYAADRIGPGRAYRAALLLQAVASAALAASANPVVIGAATVVLGIFTPGIVPLVLGRIQEILPDNHILQRAAWSKTTTAFALFQALGGYGYAFVFAHTNENYPLIFMLGAGALIAALLMDVAAANLRGGR
jgi:MFS family permease